MLKVKQNFVFGLAFVFTALAPQAFGHKDGGIVVKNAWVREAPPVSPVLAGYMVIENHTDKNQELTYVKSSAFQKIEIHKTVHKDGMATMESQNSLNIDAERSVELKPGETHLMLINPANPLKAGDTVTFVLTFSNGSKSIVSAPVKKAGPMSSEHHQGDRHHANEHQEKEHHEEEHHDNEKHHKH